MIKLFLLFCLTFTIVICRKQQSDLDSALGNYIKKKNGTNKFPTKPTIDRTRSKSNMRKTSEFAKDLHDIFTFTRDYVASNDSVNKRQAPPNPGFPSFIIQSEYCPYKNIDLKCNTNNKYRTLDGTCNNLNNYLIGSANTPYLRLLAPAYDDSIDSPRTLGIDGSPLPNPRRISLGVSQPTSVQRLSKADLSQLYAIFGQFLAHDIGATSATTDQLGDELDCPCGSTSKDCFSFSVPDQDSYLGQACVNNDGGNVGQANLTCITNAKSTQTCIKMTRSSATFPDLDCSTTYREQLNLYSAFIDGSAIYGSNPTRANFLRTFKGGMLKTSRNPVSSTTPLVPGEVLKERTYLPLSNDTCSASTTAGYKCFLAGEHRTSENVGLLGVQTLFNREHNRIASILASLNPDWNDETVYQETRRIVIAQLQHITYNEFVPEFIGDKSLSPLSSNSYYMGYDPSLNPQLSGEFSTAAFRMGHSLIRQKNGRSNINQSYDLFVNRYFPSYNFHDSVFQSDMAFNSRTQGLNSVFLGILNDVAWKFGTFGFSLQNNLFQTTYANGSTSSIDLLAFNVNRGRDHGLQPYVKYIKYCFNVTINSFDDLATKKFMNGFNVNQLRNLYRNVNDIDLYAGALSETIVQDPLYTVGPTFGCILMDQFARIKKSDRYWFENSPTVNPGAFSLEQLQQIKNVSLSGLICNNYDLDSIQPKAFFSILSDPKTRPNKLVDCKSLLNQIDLSKWKEFNIVDSLIG